MAGRPAELDLPLDALEKPKCRRRKDAPDQGFRLILGIQGQSDPPLAAGGPRPDASLAVRTNRSTMTSTL